MSKNELRFTIGWKGWVGAGLEITQGCWGLYEPEYPWVIPGSSLGTPGNVGSRSALQTIQKCVYLPAASIAYIFYRSISNSHRLQLFYRFVHKSTLILNDFRGVFLYSIGHSTRIPPRTAQMLIASVCHSAPLSATACATAHRSAPQRT